MAIRRYLRLALAGLGGLLYVWFSAVRHAGEVKRRKASRRVARGA